MGVQLSQHNKIITEKMKKIMLNVVLFALSVAIYYVVFIPNNAWRGVIPLIIVWLIDLILSMKKKKIAVAAIIFSVFWIIFGFILAGMS